MNRLTYRVNGWECQIEVEAERTEEVLDLLAKHFLRPTPEERARCEAILQAALTKEKSNGKR